MPKRKAAVPKRNPVNNIMGEIDQDYLFIAALQGDLKALIDVLEDEESDIDVNAKDNNGYTALMLIANYKNVKVEKNNFQYQMIVTLLEKGADPRIQNSQGQTALDIAKEKKNQNAINALRTHALQDSPFGKITDPGVFAHIMSFVPAYLHNDLSNVCHSWNTNLQENNTLVGKKSIQAIFDSCETVEDRHCILKDEEKIKHLPYDKLIEVASADPELAKLLLSHSFLNEGWLNRLLLTDGDMDKFQLSEAQKKASLLGDTEIVNLGKGDLSIAQFILRSNRFDTVDRVILGRAHLPIARNLLSEALKYYKSKMYYMWHHMKTVKPVLDYNQLSQLGNVHLEIACEVINHFSDNLTGADLALLGHHEPIAQHILSTPYLREKLLIKDLVSLGIDHQFVAEFLLATPKYFEQLEGSDLLSLGKAHYTVAARIIALILGGNQELREKIGLSVVHLFLHSQLRRDAYNFIQNPQMCEWMGSYGIVVFGLHYPEMAKYIISNMRFNKLLVWDDLITLGIKYHFVAQHILSRPKLCSNLSGKQLGRLGCHLPIAHQILKNKELYSKLNEGDLFRLAATEILMKMVLSNPELKSKLSSAKLEEFNQRLRLYATVTEYIHNKSELRTFTEQMNSMRL